MSSIPQNDKKKEQMVVDRDDKDSKNLLLIFTRNPELGKCKTRLAATIGNQKALDIYNFLLQHTVVVTKDVKAAKQVWYSEEIWEKDIWDAGIFTKKLQQGADLGARMALAFQEGFANGFERIIIIGSDMYDLTTTDIDQAFKALSTEDMVIGPAQDGGYYLLGMTTFTKGVFQEKAWGTDTVLKDTLTDLHDKKIHLLETRNDIDLYEDIKDIKAFQPYLDTI